MRIKATSAEIRGRFFPHVGCLFSFSKQGDMYKTEGCLKNKQTKCHKYDGNSLVYTSLSLYPSVYLCHSVFSKILMLLAYFPK